MKAIIKINGEVFPSREEVLKRAEEKKEQEIAEQPVMTLRDAFSQYIELKTGTLSPKTLKWYEHIRDEHFHRIMDMSVFCLGEEEIQMAFYDEMGRGWAKRTLQNYKSVLFSVLRMVRPDFKPVISLEIPSAE